MIAPNPEPSAPSYLDVMKAAIAARLASLHVSMPGRVVSYDKATQSASVQPLLGERYRNEAGTVKYRLLPIITNVPIMFPGGAAWGLTGPMRAGDTVTLVFADSSLDQWLFGRGQPIADGGDDRRFDLNDAIAIPGLRAFGNARADLPDNAVVLQTDDELRLVDVDADQSVIRGDAFRTSLNTLLDALGAITTNPAAATTAINTFKATWTANLASGVKVP